MSPLRRGKSLTGLAIAMCAAWALWPLGSTAPDVPDGPSAPSPVSPGETRLALDASAFRAPLWIAPPPPPAPPVKVEAPPPPPLKLQLLAIMGSAGNYRAMLYDPDADRVLVRKAGEVAGDIKVERVEAKEVELSNSAGSRTLALKPAGVKP